MNDVSSIKKERVDNLEDVENDLNYLWLEVGKTEDEKYIITAADVSSSTVGCGDENNGQLTARLDVFNNQTSRDENRENGSAEVIEHVSNIKEEKIDLENVDLGIDDKYKPEKITECKDSELAEDTCKDDNLSKSVRLYQCNFCEYKAARKDTLLRHFTTKHDDNPEWYECEFCEYRTRIKSALRSHFLVKHNSSAAELYHCKICDFRTKNKRNLRHHFVAKHDIAASWLKCHLCEFRTKIKTNIARHFKEKHTYESQFEWLHCQNCMFKTKYKATLACHYISKHPSTEEWYQCQLCEYGTKDKSDFKNHFKYEHDQDAERPQCVIIVSLNKKINCL